MGREGRSGAGPGPRSAPGGVVALPVTARFSLRRPRVQRDGRPKRRARPQKGAREGSGLRAGRTRPGGRRAGVVFETHFFSFSPLFFFRFRVARAILDPRAWSCVPLVLSRSIYRSSFCLFLCFYISQTGPADPFYFEASCPHSFVLLIRLHLLVTLALKTQLWLQRPSLCKRCVVSSKQE